MQVNTEIWGEAENAYTGFNQRTGTANINDQDFTDFPPISLCTYTDVSSYKQLLYQWINGGKLSLDDEIDKSICYVGMFNSELPQLNIVGLYNNAKNTLEDPLYKTDNTQIQSFIFTGITNYNEFADRLDWGASQLYTDTYISHDYRLRRYKNGIIGSAPNVSPQSNANCNGFLNVFQNFGIKSFILEINVKYKTGTGVYSVTTGIYTLKEYTEQTTAWKAEHPIVAAYCRPFWRSNTNGTYSYVKPSGYFCELMPVFTLPYKSNANDITDNISYHTNVCRTTATRTGYFPIYGAIAQELTNSAAASAVQEQGRAALLIGANRGTLNSITSGGAKAYWLELDGTDDDNIEYIRRGAAAYGMFFCDDIGTLADSGQDITRWIDDKMCLGTVDEDGLTNGDYTHGVQNALQRNFAWSTINDSDYDPSRPPPHVDPNHYSDSTSLPTLTYAAQNVWTDVTLGSVDIKMQIGNILDLISSTAETAFMDVTQAVAAIAYQKYNKDFIYQDPIKTILDYREIFLTQPWLRVASNEPIVLGRFYSTDPDKPFTGYKDPPQHRRVDIGSVTLWRNFENFLDFEPYSQAYLYVPFCGIKQLPMSIFGDHTINIKLHADNVTGELEVLIFVDNIEWGTMNGVASQELPLNAETSMENATTIRQLIYQKKQVELSHAIGMLGSLAGASISAAMGNPAGVITQAATAGVKKIQEQSMINELDYQIKHTKPDVLAIQTGNSEIERINCLTPFIMLQSPKLIGGDKEIVYRNYGKTKGFKCCISGNLGQFSGLTKCSNAILDGISCTYTEKKMILEALQEGVIL